MKKIRVLFVCTYQGARARIAEAITKQLAPNKIEAFSSSFEEGRIGPLPINVMKEIDIDISSEAPKSVYERYRGKEVFDYVVTLCHEETTEQCPIFSANVDILYEEDAKRLSWSVPGFKSLTGSTEEKMAAASRVRDLIKREVVKLLSQLGVEKN